MNLLKKGGLVLLLVPIFPGCMFGPVSGQEEQATENPAIKTIGFTGDVMLGRLVNKKISHVGDYAYPWGNMLLYLKNTDLNIINLETTLTTSNKAVPKVFNYKADPDKARCLIEASVDIVSLANNHSKDFGDEGLLETLSVLDQADIKHVGAGKNSAAARKPAIIDIDGLRIGVLGYTDNEPGWLAGPQSPGTHYIRVGDIDTVVQDIKMVRDQVDLLVATLHWGPNKRERPTKEFIDFAHQMIDAGIDIIHGHSAHIFQAVEVYKDRLIMYDTGDFVDDYAVYPDLRNDQSFFFIVEVEDKKLNRLRLVPVLIGNMQVNRAPEVDAKESIERMKKLCNEFGTAIKMQNDEAVISVIS